MPVLRSRRAAIAAALASLSLVVVAGCGDDVEDAVDQGQSVATEVRSEGESVIEEGQSAAGDAVDDGQSVATEARDEAGEAIDEGQSAADDATEEGRSAATEAREEAESVGDDDDDTP